MDKYDITIIGSGPGGYVSAIKAAQSGYKVALIEDKELGGVCLNWGCIPTKALLHRAETYNSLLSSDFIDFDSKNININWDKIINHSRDSANILSKGVKYLLKKNKVKIIKGKGKLVSSNTIRISNNKKKNDIKSDNIIIATGASPRSIPGIDFSMDRIISSKEAMVIKKLPKEITIIGGGAIGVEFAFLFNSFGSNVRIVELKDSLLPGSDKDISMLLESKFKDTGIEVLTGSSISNVIESKNRIRYNIGENEYSCDYCIIAVGVQGNTDGIGLNSIGIEVENSFIKKNKYLMTNIENIFTIGDVSGPPLLAHVASSEGRYVIDVISGKINNGFDYSNIPSCVYTSPEIASVGLSEKEARDKYDNIKVGKFPFSALGKAVSTNSTDGFIKVIFDDTYGELVGCHIIGKNATEIILSACIARTLETTASEILSTVHPHPTISEGFLEAVASAYGEPLHI